MAQVATDLTQLALGFHALSDETRLRVVQLLAGGERCVCELTDALDVAQSRLSFHLKTLKDAGLLVDRREGRWVYYALVPGALDDLRSELHDLKPSHSGRRSDGKCCN